MELYRRTDPFAVDSGSLRFLKLRLTETLVQRLMVGNSHSAATANATTWQTGMWEAVLKMERFPIFRECLDSWDPKDLFVLTADWHPSTHQIDITCVTDQPLTRAAMDKMVGQIVSELTTAWAKYVIEQGWDKPLLIHAYAPHRLMGIYSHLADIPIDPRFDPDGACFGLTFPSMSYQLELTPGRRGKAKPPKPNDTILSECTLPCGLTLLCPDNEVDAAEKAYRFGVTLAILDAKGVTRHKLCFHPGLPDRFLLVDVTINGAMRKGKVVDLDAALGFFPPDSDEGLAFRDQVLLSFSDPAPEEAFIKALFTRPFWEIDA